jgi:hypothetical protein
MTDRELMQEALDALTYVGDKDIYSDTIDALRARLAQPENKFNPDWDAIAVMVEEQQRMAKRIEELEARLAQPEQEPVAWGVPNTRPAEKAQFMMLLHSADGCQYPDLLVPLYTAPQQREWVGLTDDEIEGITARVLTTLTQDVWPIALSRAIEAKLKEKNV